MLAESKTVSIKNWTHCPYRGLKSQPPDSRGIPQPPIKVGLDDRCPTHVQAIPDLVDTGLKTEQPSAEAPKRGRPKKGEIRIPVEPSASEEIVMLVPILEEDSYCFSCVTERTREREMGLSSGKGSIGFSAEKKRGRPRKS